MNRRTTFGYDSFRGQCVMLLLGALNELGGTGTRREVMAYIAEHRYFDIEAEDRLPFPTANRSEPRWELLMRWVFPACLDGGCILETVEGCWELTREGAKLYSRTVKRLREGTFDAHRCYLWTGEFKKRLVPTYEPRPGDRHRPARLYEEVRWQLADVALDARV